MKTTKMVARIAELVLAGMMVMGLASCGGNPVKGKTFHSDHGRYDDFGDLTIEFKDGKNVVFTGEYVKFMTDGSDAGVSDKFETTYEITRRDEDKLEIDFVYPARNRSSSRECLDYYIKEGDLRYENYGGYDVKNNLKEVKK